ncbi:MAG: TRAP transporter substrate-binding protein [Paracoccaceae bacterium]
MRRRDLIGGAGLATLLGGPSLAAPAISTGGLRLNMLTAWPRTLPILPRSAERLARRIETLTEGFLRIDVFHAGERAGAEDPFSAIERGEAECYHGAEYFWMDRHPGFAFFTAVPFGLNEREMAAWLQAGGGQALWDRLSDRFGVRAFSAGNTGGQLGGWFPAPVQTLADIEGLRISVPGLAARVWAAAGAVPVQVAPGDLALAVIDGEVDAVDWLGPRQDLEIGFVKLLPAHMAPGWQEPGMELSFGIAAALFDVLAPSVQAIIRAATAEEALRLRAECRLENGRAFNLLRREFETAFTRFPDPLLIELHRTAASVIAETATHDALALEIYDSFWQFRRRTVRHAEIGAGPYLASRNGALGLDAVYDYN